MTNNTLISRIRGKGGQTRDLSMANRGRERYYVQSALNIDDPDKTAQEKRPFTKLGDSFRKIIIVKGKMSPRTDEKGYVTIGLIDFLLSPGSILV